ncbi:MAG: hypothetical protein AAB368_11600, partial [bacterium]
VPPGGLRADPATRSCALYAAGAQTLTLIPATDAWEGLRTWRARDGLARAGGVERLAGRFVFDLWGERVAAKALPALERSFRYGLTDAVVIWHDWQRWGYDNRLPDIWPPNPARGAPEELAALARACERRGALFALHDNYIDLYPDAEAFTYDDVAFDAAGRPVRAWYNEWRKAQSYRWRPDRMRGALERNLRLIRTGVAPTAYFIDVWSSVAPHDWWTRSGTYHAARDTRKQWRDAFAWIRGFLGHDAPQISESGHDQLVGWLDGATANHLRVGLPPAGAYAWSVWDIRCADAERVPWFDAALHDRFILHGAGYEPRYAAGLDSAAHGIYSDDYLSTEVLTGHPAMVKDAFSRDTVRIYWLLHGLGRALALKRIERVAFEGGNLHRQRVAWEGGGAVEVNRGTDDWTADGRVLAPYGFHARVPVEAGSVDIAVERQGGGIVEWSRGPEELYLNARGTGTVTAYGATTGGGCRIARDGDRCVVTPLPEGGPFTVELRWPELPWRLPSPRLAEAVDEDGTVLREVPLARAGDTVTLACDGKDFAYRVR